MSAAKPSGVATTPATTTTAASVAIGTSAANSAPVVTSNSPTTRTVPEDATATTALEYALKYAELGLHVIPLWSTDGGGACACPAGPRCDSRRRGKHPRIAGWQHLATTDRDRLACWFRRGGNLGIVCHPSGVVVIDVEHPDSHDDDGYATLLKRERELGRLPPTPTAESGGGGLHYVYREPAAPLVTSAGPGIDVLTGRHYFIVSPSVHPSGRQYRWRDGCAPWEIAIADLPAAWIASLSRRDRVNRPRAARTANSDATSFFVALHELDQGYVLLRISGSPLVHGERITLASANARGNRAIVVNGRTTGGFVDANGRICHRPTRPDRSDGGPSVSTWCRYYGFDDRTIRAMLADLVPELARFQSGGVRRTGRGEPSPADLRQRAVATGPRAIVPYEASTDGVALYESLDLHLDGGRDNE